MNLKIATTAFSDLTVRPLLAGSSLIAKGRPMQVRVRVEQNYKFPEG